MVIEPLGSAPPRPVDRDATREHVGRNAVALRKAFGDLRRVCKGRLHGDVQVGLDHTVEDPTKQWWARVYIQGNRAVASFLDEGHPSAVAAMEALTLQVDPVVRRLNRRRR